MGGNVPAQKIVTYSQDPFLFFGFLILDHQQQQQPLKQ